MSTNLNYKQVANVSRRTWDVETYTKRAEQRVNNEIAASTTTSASSSHPQQRRNHGATGDGVNGVGSGLSSGANTVDHSGEASTTDREEFVPAAAGAAGPAMSKRAFLKARTNKLDGLIDSKIGSVEIINPEAVATVKANSTVSGGPVVGNRDAAAVTKSGIGWHCKVCDCFLRDSLTYLDHINGRKHQRNLGYSMRVERSTKDQVLSRLAVMAKDKEVSESKSGWMDGLDVEADEDEKYHAIVMAKDEELKRQREERKRERKDRRKKKKDTVKGKQQPEEAGNASGLATSEDIVNEPENEDEEEEEGGDTDPALAAIMGFTGFGGAGKIR